MRASGGLDVQVTLSVDGETAAANERAVRLIYASVAAGDISGVLALLAPTVVAYQAASLPYGGEYHGLEGFARMAAAITRTWEDFQVEPSVFVASGDRVVVLTTMRGHRPGSRTAWAMPMAEVWTLTGGRVTEVRPFYWDTAALPV